MKTSKLFVVMLAMIGSSGFNKAICQWNTIVNDIYNTNTGNVAIGNNSPSTLLYVAKNMTEPTITVRNLGGVGGATYSMVDNASGADWKFKATGTGGFKIRDNANGLDVILIEPNSAANVLYINASGYTGIQTATPRGTLDVNSGASANEALYVKAAPSVDDQGGIIHHQSSLYGWQEVAQQTGSSTEGKLQFHYVNLNNPSTKIKENVLSLQASGNIGIGIATPNSSAILDLTSTNRGFLPPRMTASQRTAISAPATGLLVYQTDATAGYYVYTGAAWTSLTGGTTHYIGESYGGGIVFYVFDNGQHGLIAATSDQSDARWYGGSYTNTCARADGVGAGLKNTAIIIANQGPVDGNTFAARICNEYTVTVGGVTYGDWYLPSKHELNLMYLQMEAIGNFEPSRYWSSTEVSSNYAWSQYFADGSQSSTVNKPSSGVVRPIRLF